MCLYSSMQKVMKKKTNLGVILTETFSFQCCFFMVKWENSGYLRNYCNQWPENLKVQTTNSVNESKLVKVTVKVIS